MSLSVRKVTGLAASLRKPRVKNSREKVEPWFSSCLSLRDSCWNLWEVPTTIHTAESPAEEHSNKEDSVHQRMELLLVSDRFHSDSRLQQAEKQYQVEVSQHQEGRATKESAEYWDSRGSGEKCKRLHLPKSSFPPKLKNECCQKRWLSPRLFVKATQRNESQIDYPRSPCIPFSTVAFQLEENTRPN